MKLRSMAVSVLTASVLSLSTVALAEYPEKPVQFIVPWSPGGVLEVFPRKRT